MPRFADRSYFSTLSDERLQLLRDQAEQEGRSTEPYDDEIERRTLGHAKYKSELSTYQEAPAYAEAKTLYEQSAARKQAAIATESEKKAAIGISEPGGIVSRAETTRINARANLLRAEQLGEYRNKALAFRKEFLDYRQRHDELNAQLAREKFDQSKLAMQVERRQSLSRDLQRLSKNMTNEMTKLADSNEADRETLKTASEEAKVSISKDITSRQETIDSLKQQHTETEARREAVDKEVVDLLKVKVPPPAAKQEAPKVPTERPYQTPIPSIMGYVPPAYPSGQEPATQAPPQPAPQVAPSTQPAPATRKISIDEYLSKTKFKTPSARSRARAILLNASGGARAGEPNAVRVFEQYGIAY